jgi:hypothetical protein
MVFIVEADGNINQELRSRSFAGNGPVIIIMHKLFFVIELS